MLRTETLRSIEGGHWIWHAKQAATWWARKGKITFTQATFWRDANIKSCMGCMVREVSHISPAGCQDMLLPGQWIWSRLKSSRKASRVVALLTGQAHQQNCTWTREVWWLWTSPWCCRIKNSTQIWHHPSPSLIFSPAAPFCSAPIQLVEPEASCGLLRAEDSPEVLKVEPPHCKCGRLCEVLGIRLASVFASAVWAASGPTMLTEDASKSINWVSTSDATVRLACCALMVLLGDSA